MDIVDRVKCVLIQNNNHVKPEQEILNRIYQNLYKKRFEYNENRELPHIKQYLVNHNGDENVNEQFCFSAKSKKNGMKTSYLIENLDPERTNNSSIVCLDKDTDHVLGVLSFNYIQMFNNVYTNSLYIVSFCTNQQNPMPGLGKLLLTSIIEATAELKSVANIVVIASTEHSEGFYKKFKFKQTGSQYNGMNELQYTIHTEPSQTYVKNWSGGTVRVKMQHYRRKRTIKNKRKTKNKQRKKQITRRNPI
jgi:hypothetical protein